MKTDITLAGDLGKPASTLIEKISEAIGGIARPWQIRRVATAEAQAEIVRAEASLQISDLERRAVERLFREEAKKQENIESITAKALPLLADDSTPSDVEDDWITKFFDNCRSVSNEEMQAIWAKLLAAEANASGTVSRRTIDVLSSLDRSDAELFSRITQFSIDDHNQRIVIYDKDNPIYMDEGFGFAGLTRLADLGLLQAEFLTGFVSQLAADKVKVDYHNRLVTMTLPGPPYSLSIGHVRLTAAGAQITQMLPRLKNEKFLDYLISVWSENNYEPREIKGSDFVTARSS